VTVVERLGSASVVELARGALGASDDAWIAGGAVRDAALGRQVDDLDLAVAGDPAAGAKTIAREGGGHAFELSAEFATWRAVATDGGWQVDLTALRGATIEDDLRERDFTVGAVAVPLAGGEPIDPYGGLADLERGVLRTVTEPLVSRPTWGSRSPARRLPWPARKPPARPSRPASDSWPSCGSSSAAPNRCGASRCSTSSG
jgi:hypothetical protein